MLFANHKVKRQVHIEIDGVESDRVHENKLIGQDSPG